MFGFLNNAIENIKDKPEYIRIRYAWGLSILCVFVIGAVWVTTLRSKFEADSSVFKSVGQSETEEAMESINSGIADIKEIMDGSLSEEGSVNPFGETNVLDEGNEEARLPQAEGSEGAEDQEESDSDIIREGDNSPNETDIEDYTEEELQEYLKEQEEDFRRQMEEDFGGQY